MARQFGGKFSPGGRAADTSPAPGSGTGGGTGPAGTGRGGADPGGVDRAGMRANLLFVPPAILAVTAFGDGPLMLVVSLGAAAVLVLSAWLLREGLKAEAAYNARKVARRPAFPRKAAATLLTGLAIAAASWTGGAGLAGAVLYGIAAAGLHLAAFGIDPMRDKRMEGIDRFQQDRVARVVEEAEAHIANIRETIAGVKDRGLGARVEAFLGVAARLIRTVEEDPRDLTAARKYLSVYLRGADEATAKFVEVYTRGGSAEARAKYESLLTDLESNFAARTEKLLLNDQEDMEIEIKVLQDRLQREGVR